MTEDRKTAAGFPFAIACICAAVIGIILASSFIAGNPGASPDAGNPPAPSPVCACMETSGITGSSYPALQVPVCTGVLQPAPVRPVTSETLPVATLHLEQPATADIVAYTQRGFIRPVEASIAWWMSPGFIDNTTEFRVYERKSPEGKAAYPEEHRIFFNFITGNLDTAEQLSHLHDTIILFRGISPGFAATVINESRYREPAFASTSYDITLSLDAFAVRSPDGYRNVLVLTRHSGDHAFYINEDEREFLLPRGMTWNVVKAVAIENLTVTAGFLLHNRTQTAASFDHVRLMYITEAACP